MIHTAYTGNETAIQTDTSNNMEVTMLDKILLSDWISLITALGVIVAMVTSIFSMTKSSRKEADADTRAVTEMRSDVKHIREKVDKLEDIPERLWAVEESAKQAHIRIDRIMNTERD